MSFLITIITHVARFLTDFSILIYDTLLLFSFDDPGPHGKGRHMDHMLPEIPKEDFRKGAQVKNISLIQYYACFML